MRKLFILFLIILIVLPTFARADGMWLPRYRPTTYNFSSIKEKQQYATIEVLSNYFERMNLYLALTSMDYEDHDITIIIPLKSIPQDVTGDEIKSTEFLSKYEFENVKQLVEEQSLGGFIKKASPQTRDYLGEYIMLSIFSPLYEITKIPVFYPFYAGTFGVAEQAAKAAVGTGLPPGVTPVAKYEFEGVTVDIYDVESGQVLEDFMRDYYQLELPDVVKTSVDKYKTHYIAVLNAMVGPPADVNLLKEYAPNTFKDALSYVRANPKFSFVCGRYGYTYPTGALSIAKPYPYYECTDREAIRQKFSDYIQRAKDEAAGKPIQINQTDDTQKLLYKDGNFIRLECTYDVRYFDGRTCTAYVDLDLNELTYVNKVTIRHRNCLCSCCCGYCDEPDGIKLITSKDNVNWNFIGFDDPYSTIDWKDITFDVDDTVRYVKICRGRGGCDRSDNDLDYVDIDGVSYNVNLIYPQTTDVIESPIEKAMIDFFLAVYSNSTKGFELGMTLPIKDSEIFYPLGTGVAWATPIEDTRIVVKMSKDLDINFRNVQSSAIDENNRYYLWEFKNWNPSYDIVGKLGPSGFLTNIGDGIKVLLEVMIENSWAFAILFVIVSFGIAGIVVKLKGRGDPKRRLIFSIFTFIFAPFVSIWLVAILAYGLKTKPKSEELKENMINVLIFVGVLFLVWIFMAVVSIIVGG